LMRRWITAGVFFSAAAAAAAIYWHDSVRLSGWWAAQVHGTAPAPAPRASIPVETATARTAKSSADIRAVGSLRSDESVVIAPEIAGRIAEIGFAEGGRSTPAMS
jgi:membrane fusion protein (multidrug efflux system)